MQCKTTQIEIYIHWEKLPIQIKYLFFNCGGSAFSPVKHSGALVAHRGVTVKRKQDVSFFAQLAHEAFGLTALQHTSQGHKLSALLWTLKLPGSSRRSSPRSLTWCAWQTWCGSRSASSSGGRWRCRSGPAGSTCRRSPQSAAGPGAAGKKQKSFSQSWSMYLTLKVTQGVRSAGVCRRTHWNLRLTTLNSPSQKCKYCDICYNTI